MKKSLKLVLGTLMVTATLFTCSSSHEVCPAYSKAPVQGVEKI